MKNIAILRVEDKLFVPRAQLVDDEQADELTKYFRSRRTP